jgi:streptogramin lyase
MPRRHLRLGLLASLALCFAGVAPPAQAIPPPQVFTAGLPADAGPVALAAAADGDVWFSQITPGTPLGRITPAGTIVEQPMPQLAADLTSPPRALAVGPDGDLWLMTAQDILRMTPGGSVTDYAPSLGGALPVGIAVAADGSLWFTDGEGAGAIDHLTEPGQLTRYATGLTPGGDVDGITLGPDGNMWFTERAGRIGRITPQGVITEFAAPGGSPSQIVTGADGNLWFVQRGVVGAVGRITPSGAITEFPTGAVPQDIAPGPDGQMYFTEPYGVENLPPWGPPAIGSISLSGQLSQEVIGTMFPFTSAWSIVAGAGGDLWLTFPGDPAAIGELAFPPEVTLGEAPAVTGSGVTLSGDVQTNGQVTTCFFQYGPTTAYGEQSATQTVVAGIGPSPVSAPIVGLAPGTTYHYRLVATNPGGTTDGPDATFTTAGATTAVTAATAGAPAATARAPAATQGVVPGSSGTPAKGGVRLAAAAVRAHPVDGGLDGVGLGPLSLAGVVAGRSVAAGLVSGTVYAHARGAARRFVLTGRVVLPVGSRVDARDGVVKLTAVRRPSAHAARVGAAARASGVGAAETIALSDGQFSIAQPSRAGGPVVITLLGGRFRGCPVLGRAQIAASRRAASRRSRVVRQLWSSDSGGQFSTHGRDSVGTVQGTLWQTADRCDGTLTHVARGRVLVIALHVRRRVLLRAGQSYLAPAVGR